MKNLATNPLTNARVYVDDSGIVRLQNEDGGDAADSDVVGPMPWTQFIARVNADALRGRPTQMGPGTWTCDAAVALASGAHIIGGPGVRVVAALAGTTQLDACFFANQTVGTSTVLSSGAAVGALSVSVTADVCAVGEYLGLQPTHLGVNAGLRTRIYQVVAKSGAGPYSYTLDRPLGDDYSTNDVAFHTTPVVDVTIDGAGMQMSGACGRFVEFAATQRCTVKNIRATGTVGDIPFSYDVGGYRNRFENIDVDCSAAATIVAGVALEAQDESALVRCRSRRASAGGAASFVLYDTNNCVVEDCEGEASALGLVLQSDGNAGVGTSCNRTRIVGGTFSRNVDGIKVMQGCTDTLIERSTCAYNTDNGILLGDTTTGDLGTRVLGCTCDRNTGQNVRVSALVDNTQIVGCYLEGGTVSAYGIYVDSVLLTSVADTYIHVAKSGTPIGVYSPGVTQLRDCRLVCNVNVGISLPSATSDVIVSGCLIELGDTTNGIHINNAAAVMRLDTTTIKALAGKTPNQHIYVQAGTLRRAGSYRGNAPFVTGYDSVGQLVSGGAGAAQNVAWPDLKATDHVTWTRIVNGGAPGIMPLSVNTPATGFAATFAAGDTSTYEWKIE